MLEEILLKKVTFPRDSKCEMKLQPVHMNSVCMMDARPESFLVPIVDYSGVYTVVGLSVECEQVE